MPLSANQRDVFAALVAAANEVITAAIEWDDKPSDRARVQLLRTRIADYRDAAFAWSLVALTLAMLDDAAQKD